MQREYPRRSPSEDLHIAVAAEYSAEQDFAALDAVAEALAVAAGSVAWLVVADPSFGFALFLDS